MVERSFFPTGQTFAKVGPTADNPWAGRPGTISGLPIDASDTDSKHTPAVPGASQSPSAAKRGDDEAAGEERAASPAAEASGELNDAARANAFARFGEFSRPLFEKFSTEVHGGPPELLAHAKAWLFDVSRDTTKLDQVKREHAYNLSPASIGVRGRDAAAVVSFLNAMSRNGVSEEDALRTVGWMRDANRNGAIAQLLKGKRAPAVAAAPASMSHGQEIAAIERTMRDNRRAYNRDTAMQARYLELLSQREAQA